MYKLLIVDDEAWIRERIRTTINWVEMDVEVIGEAGDGEEALELAIKLAPHIVITDIRMPGIDGLEFIKRLNEAKSKIKAIIISGYNDFDYARKAIKLGAFDYILKPVEDDNLISVIKNCIIEIEKEEKKEIWFKDATKQIEKSLPLMKEKFLISLINKNFISENEVKKELSYFNIKNNGLLHICFIVYTEDNAITIDKKWDNHLYNFVLCNIINDFASKLGKCESFFLYTGEIVCIISSESNEEVINRQVMSISNGIRKITKKILDSVITIGIGSTCNDLINISDSFMEAKQALSYKAYFGKDRIYNIGSIDTEFRPNNYRLHDLEVLLNNIKMGNKKEALISLEEIIKTPDKNGKALPPLDFKLIYIDVFNSVFKTIIELNAASEDFSEFSYTFLEQLNKIETAEEAIKWLSELVIKCIDKIDKLRTSKKRKIVEKALEYIRNQYREPISLNDIADKLYLNASYFCKIFREETGESFTKYLMKLRVDKAIELMSDPTLKIYEIANLVGYEDIQYFTKMFKTIRGVTPVQYREKIK